jgi:hypothetical protein
MGGSQKNMGKALDLEAVAAELREWSALHNLVEKALASARVSLHNCQQDEAEIGLRPSADYGQLVLKFEKQSLVFKNDLVGVYVDTQIGLYLPSESKAYFQGLEPVGCYRLITGTDGQVDDDYLIFDKP